MRIVSVLSAALLFTITTAAQNVKIGSQVWMTKNLDLSKFRNGDPIPQVKSGEEWQKARVNSIPAWCYYDYDPANGGKYGKLYNWFAVNDPRGLTPTGWHIPSDAEWTQLSEFLGGEDVAGNKMKSIEGWKAALNDGTKGTNSSGFSALPGGNGTFGFDENFDYAGGYGCWWSSTEANSFNAWARSLSSYKSSVSRDESAKDSFYSVRLIKD